MNLQQLFTEVLTFLDGKKAKIAGIAGVVIGYLASVGYMDTGLATALLSIINIILGGASVATPSVLGASQPRIK